MVTRPPDVQASQCSDYIEVTVNLPKLNSEPNIVAQTCNLRVWKDETGRLL